MTVRRALRRTPMWFVPLSMAGPKTSCLSVNQWRDEPMLNPDYMKGLSKLDAQNRTTWVDLKLARALLFADCDEPPAMAALNRLGPQARYPSTVPFPLAEFPSVRCTAVVCSDDQFVYPDCLRQVARDRLGADIVELPGSHSPFLSRPSALAEVLLRIADGN